MSRVAKKPIVLPKGVEAKIDGKVISVKGPKGQLQHILPETISVEQVDGALQIAINEKAPNVIRFGADSAKPMAGTTRALLNNIVSGVSEGFSKKLLLIGVGYRVQVQGKKLNLTLGLSHPVIHELPEGIKAEAPSATEIIISGIDKQLVGQVAADIRAYRPPEPYKGKGIRYDGEHIIMKETKKK